LDPARVRAAVRGEDPVGIGIRRSWWEALIIAAAVGVFVWLACLAELPPLETNVSWAWLIGVASVVPLLFAASMLWKRTRFS
jgi:hypothetical protein